MEQRQSKQSTNPFDSFSASEEGSAEGGEENFYDCHEDAPDHQIEPTTTTTTTTENANTVNTVASTNRAAPLDFENPFDDIEQPALDFDIKPTNSNEFFSPLENAMMQLGGMSSSPTKAARNRGFSSFSEDEDDEEAALLIDNIHTNNAAKVDSPSLLHGSRDTASANVSELSSSAASSYTKKKRVSIPKEISTGGPIQKKKGRRHSQRNSLTNNNNNNNLVLKHLAGGENEFIMDYKYILLEDLGTASSWLVLLLPYIAFLLSVLLASSKSLQVATTGPLHATTPCDRNIVNTRLSPAPMEPCYCHFQKQMRIANGTAVAKEGFTFESGVLESLPVVSTYLYGDAAYEGLSTATVALVAQGKLEASVQLLQRDLVSTEGDRDSDGTWKLMFSSVPRRVTMVCSKQDDDDDDNGSAESTLWNCKTPRLLDILFSMPGTAVYAGGDIRFNVFYSVRETDIPLQQSAHYFYGDEDDVDLSHVYFQDGNSSGLLSTATVSSSHSAYIEEVASSSTYMLEHMSQFALKLDTGIRLVTFLVSFFFMIYWCRSMGLHSLCCCRRTAPTVTLWWESPWILFPERCYILVLLFALLLMQEPLLSAMFFYPQLGASTRLHLAADACIGVGVHGVLFVYLCLFHGFRFHTAKVARKRTEHQRKSLQLRKAAKYVSATRNKGLSTEEKISEYTNEYYEQFGDIDGSASTGHLRLQNDPCADGWADFLLFKVILFLIGVASVVATAYCRFPPDDDNVAHLSSVLLDRYKKGYVISITMQFIVLLIWVYLIIEAAIATGNKMRNEPFLSTRPAQLAYRILFAHMSLGLIALIVAFVFNLSQLITKWSLQLPDDDSLAPLITHHVDDLSHMEIVMRVVSQVARQFPYSGTAASVGAGRIIYATVSILITAFIFLPAHLLEEDDDEGIDGHHHNTIFNEQRRLRRDKRLVVHLARESKTWRVFPIPIEPSALETTMLQDRGYQLYKNLHIEFHNIRERGVVSVGPYTPVFCVELACWLNEASWQAYYSPVGLLEDSPASIRTGMNLESIGLRMEGVVYDMATDSQAYIATNIAAQVDGDEDSIIVIAFRGTASTSNLHTDLRSRQVPLLDQVAGIGSSPFCIFPDRVEIYDSDGWIWDAPEPTKRADVKCATTWTGSSPGCMPFRCSRKVEPFEAVSKGARAILQATPVARSSFPRVHEGFQEVYIQLRRKLLDILFPVMQRQLAKSLEKENDNPNSLKEPLALPKIYCTGHSLGGSLAQLLALDLASNCEIVLPVASDSSFAAVPFATAMNTIEDELFNLPSPTSYQKSEHGTAFPFPATTTSSNPPPPTKATANREIRLKPPIAVYTFGQPRVGNKAFSRLYKQKVPHTFRVVNEGDVITTMPNLVFCGGMYKHSGLAVLLDEGMTGNILVGPTVVETVFRFHQVTANVVAHTMSRYRDCLECAFEEDELVEYYKGHNGVGKDNVLGKTGQDVHIPEWMTNIRSK